MDSPNTEAVQATERRPRRVGVVVAYDPTTGRGKIHCPSNDKTYNFGAKRDFLAADVQVSFRAAKIRAYHVRRVRDGES